MGAREVLSEALAAGLTVTAEGDKLMVRPSGKLPNDLRAALVRHKPEVLAILSAPAMTSPSGGSVPSPAGPFRLNREDSDRCHDGGWSADEITTFTERVSLFVRRGLSVADSDDLAEALVLRDREEDEPRRCLECAHLSGNAAHAWRCRSARAAGISAELPADLVTLPQRCPTYRAMS